VSEVRDDRGLIDLVRTVAERGDISLSAKECERILELLELGRDTATLDTGAVAFGTNVPQVQRGLVGEKWDLFLWTGEGRERFVGETPAAARAVAAAALRLRGDTKP
jgi:hypothetical protein